MSTVGERIRRQRQKLDLTQERLAAAAGISKGFLSDVETNTRNPSAEYLLRIANALAVSLDYLMKGGDESASSVKRVDFPASLAAFAMKRGLSFNEAKSVLDAKMQFVANRRDALDDDLENFDWEGFYDAIKEFL